ncbi:ATP-binding cassette domain-containing protein [Escherichia coli]|nr:ATP-binding cassette domain-containing protein [Escherichia coli]MCB4442473.1 ATP-binding cassette domain-containing protein [Escherichia coli]
MTYAVEFDNVSRLYGDVRAVDGVSVAIKDGEFFSMLGPSGSGKTTCLRLIAGFEQLSGGAISIFGKSASNLPPWERDVNTVFQDYALFPHMSILDNVAYGLMVKGVNKKQRHAMAQEALEKVALGFVQQRKPSQLSGGQRQRVAIASAILAFPMAWYMARYTSGKMKAFFYIAVMLPMWASYIVKAYAWTLLLAKDGVAQWFLQHLGLEPLLTAFLTLPAVGGNTLSTSGLGRFLVFLYIWLPFMILPVQAALERLPPSLLQASADLGARPRQTFRYVVLPLAIPGIAAGSIFTFSLTLGDFIVPQLVGPPGYFIGNMVYSQQGAIGNMPMAAAFTLVPIVLIALYLAFVKRLGAFDAL